MRPKLAILGTRGIPGNHGGFETFAEELSLYLSQHGWDIQVYCQESGRGKIYSDIWNRIRRIIIPVTWQGALGTILFDWYSVLKVRKTDRIVLLLGYNTAIFCLFLKFKSMKVIINMDGIEWKRKKWRLWEKIWLFVNEMAGVILSDHMVADHPQIKKRLDSLISLKKTTYIPYSAKRITAPDASILKSMALQPYQYTLLIARPEPENLILEIVKAYSARRRDIKLVVLGSYDQTNSYHRLVLDEAGQDVRFVGAIYDKPIVQTLRVFTRFYIHGHTVGGTNPSLVEALSAGSAILASNNVFNRGVAGTGALYFENQKTCEEKLERMLNNDALINALRAESRKRFLKYYTFHRVYPEYDKLLRSFWEKRLINRAE